MRNIEMHCHSTRSDGKNTLQEVLQEAQKQQLEFLALTDHDVIAPKSFQDALKSLGIDTCDSVEISARNDDLDKSLHLVSYARIFHDSLHDVLEDSLKGKLDMKVWQLQKLTWEFGFQWSEEGFESFMLSLGRSLESSNKYDLVRYLSQNERNQTLMQQTLWNDWNGNNVVEDFYFECLKREWSLYDMYGYESAEYEPSVEQTVQEVVEKSWGIVSLAHPNVTFDEKKWWIQEFERTLPDYVRKWVRGIEVNSIAPHEWVKVILKARSKYDLILTFGSDCHNIGKPDSTHSSIGRLNPFIKSDLIEENFKRFQKEINRR